MPQMKNIRCNTIAMRPRLLMNFTLRCVRFYPGVNNRADNLVTRARLPCEINNPHPGLTPGTALRAIGLGSLSLPRPGRSKTRLERPGTVPQYRE